MWKEFKYVIMNTRNKMCNKIKGLKVQEFFITSKISSLFSLPFNDCRGRTPRG